MISTVTKMTVNKFVSKEYFRSIIQNYSLFQINKLKMNFFPAITFLQLYLGTESGIKRNLLALFTGIVAE